MRIAVPILGIIGAFVVVMLAFNTLIDLSITGAALTGNAPRFFEVLPTLIAVIALPALIFGVIVAVYKTTS